MMLGRVAGMDLPKYVSTQDSTGETSPVASTSTLPPLNSSDLGWTAGIPGNENGWHNTIDSLTTVADDEYNDSGPTVPNSPTATHPMSFISGSYKHNSISRLLNSTDVPVERVTGPKAPLPKRRPGLGDPITRGIMSVDMAKQLFA